MTKHTDIGFIGLGQMGSAMAERLLGKDFRLHVFDTNAAAVKPFTDGGATAHDTPKSVADVASIVFACLPGQKISLDVAFGPQGVIHGKAIEVYVETSTIGKETIDRIAATLAERKIGTVDCPVTGGPPVARAGGLTMLGSGEPANFAAVQPLLALIGKNVYHLGDKPGLGQAMKIVNNIIMATNVVVAAEGLAFGTKAGLDAGQMLEILSNGTGQSFACNRIIANGVEGKFNYGASIMILDKDMTLGMYEAGVLGAELPVTDRARETWHAAYEAGMGDKDFTAILEWVEKASGTVVRSGNPGS
ncbi:NAD(P)-dependent oxidoreductase [Ramlibacter sp.]|uniref:NAD(P)-dependent oxidoreductase n=1 Tax=Ramlibacter sp. TaxID=1917967 RepID=UPI003D0EA90B